MVKLAWSPSKVVFLLDLTLLLWYLPNWWCCSCSNEAVRLYYSLVSVSYTVSCWPICKCFSTWPQVERLPILIDSPKKLDHQLSSDPDKTPVSNAANTDSEPEDMNQPGEAKSIRQAQYVVSHCDGAHETTDALIRLLSEAGENLFLFYLYCFRRFCIKLRHYKASPSSRLLDTHSYCRRITDVANRYRPDKLLWAAVINDDKCCTCCPLWVRTEKAALSVITCLCVSSPNHLTCVCASVF